MWTLSRSWTATSSCSSRCFATPRASRLTTFTWSEPTGSSRPLSGLWPSACKSTGESKATAVEALSKDAAAVETVGAHIPDKEFAAELREFHIELRADVKELLRRESSLRYGSRRSQQSMRQRLDHITELLEETTLRSPSATLTPVREAVANVDAEAPPPGSTALHVADRIHVAEAPVPAPLVEAPAPALDAAAAAPAPAPAEKDEIYLTQSSITFEGPIQLVG